MVVLLLMPLASRVVFSPAPIPSAPLLWARWHPVARQSASSRRCLLTLDLYTLGCDREDASTHPLHQRLPFFLPCFLISRWLASAWTINSIVTYTEIKVEMFKIKFKGLFDLDRELTRDMLIVRGSSRIRDKINVRVRLQRARTLRTSWRRASGYCMAWDASGDQLQMPLRDPRAWIRSSVRPMCCVSVCLTRGSLLP